MADNVAIVKGAHEALTKGEINTFLGALDEQVEWHLPEHHTLWRGKALVGPQAVLEGHLARIAQVYDGFQIDLQRVVALGDTVLAEMRCRGKGKATGQDLDVQTAQVWDLRDGKCVRWQEYLGHVAASAGGELHALAVTDRSSRRIQMIWILLLSFCSGKPNDSRG